MSRDSKLRICHWNCCILFVFLSTLSMIFFGTEFRPLISVENLNWICALPWNFARSDEVFRSLLRTSSSHLVCTTIRTIPPVWQWKNADCWYRNCSSLRWICHLHKTKTVSHRMDGLICYQDVEQRIRPYHLHLEEPTTKYTSFSLTMWME